MNMAREQCVRDIPKNVCVPAENSGEMSHKVFNASDTSWKMPNKINAGSWLTRVNSYFQISYSLAMSAIS
jgi:hypothetical protein